MIQRFDRMYFQAPKSMPKHAPINKQIVVVVAIATAAATSVATVHLQLETKKLTKLHHRSSSGVPKKKLRKSVS